MSAFGCARKVRWTSAACAEGHRLALLARARANDPGRLHSYRCDECGGWHVGHGNGRVPRWCEDYHMTLTEIIRPDDTARRRC